MWKTVWIMCKTLFWQEVAGVSPDYALWSAWSLFSEFYGFLSKTGKNGVWGR